MSTINQFKSAWQNDNPDAGMLKPINDKGLALIIKMRTKKNLNMVMRYFWASFTLQMIVYALLTHVIIKYGGDRETLIAGIAGVLLFIPFTVVLMRKFKAMATTRIKEATSNASVQSYVERHYNLLASFFQFKKNYELVLVPLASAIGTFLTFKLYVRGGIHSYQSAAWVIFGITILSCAAAIKRENRKSFERPLEELKKIRDEFESGGEGQKGHAE